jgi:c-di-GMP-binding flagellar brake protein YcgR
MEERRTAPRCTDIPVTIHQCVITHLGKETWLSATAYDISSRGLCLLLEDSLNSGESIYLLASVKPEGQAPRDLSVNAVTTYCRPTEGSTWRVGVEFIDLTPEEKADWHDFLEC